MPEKEQVELLHLVKIVHTVETVEYYLIRDTHIDHAVQLAEKGNEVAFHKSKIIDRRKADAALPFPGNFKDDDIIEGSGKNA